MLSEDCSCRPMPPAPTRPSTGRFTDVDVPAEDADAGKGGHDLRHDAEGHHLPALAPVAVIASTCFSSISSIAS